MNTAAEVLGIFCLKREVAAYEETAGLVVVARDHDDVLLILEDGGPGDEGLEAWRHVDCVRIGTAAPGVGRGLVLCEFHAG